MGSHSSVVDISATGVQRWAQPTLPLPPLDNLAACIQGPLAEDNNIPLSENFMRQLTLVQVNPRAMCNMDDVKQLFRLSEDEQVDILLTTIKSSLMFSPPDNDSTECIPHILGQLYPKAPGSCYPVQKCLGQQWADKSCYPKAGLWSLNWQCLHVQRRRESAQIPWATS